MAVWRVSNRPEINLNPWKLVRFDTKYGTDYILVGYNVDENEGRVSTSIAHYDPHHKIARTHSGRVYHLGEYGEDVDASHTLGVKERMVDTKSVHYSEQEANAALMEFANDYT